MRARHRIEVKKIMCEFHRISDPEHAKHDEQDFAEFKAVCSPVVEYIQKKYGSPHHRVIIDWASAVIVEDLHGVGFNPPD